MSKRTQTSAEPWWENVALLSHAVGRFRESLLNYKITEPTWWSEVFSRFCVSQWTSVSRFWAPGRGLSSSPAPSLCLQRYRSIYYSKQATKSIKEILINVPLLNPVSLYSWSEATSASRRFTRADTAAGSWLGCITCPKGSWSPTASRTGAVCFQCVRQTKKQSCFLFKATCNLILVHWFPGPANQSRHTDGDLPCWAEPVVAVSRYTLQASTFQMAILLQYNTEDSYTVQQLTDSTQIKTVSLTLARSHRL